MTILHLDYILGQLQRMTNRRYPELAKYLKDAPPNVLRELSQLARDLEQELTAAKRRSKMWWRG